MIEIGTAMLLFTAVAVLLAAFVLLARHALIPQRTVTIDVNGQRSVSADSGDKLLWSLAAANIVLPAACGGRGSCGQCRVRVTDGARPLLPAEANHIARRDAAAGYRLACLMTVHEDLAVEVAPEILAARPWQVTVEACRFLAPLLRELTLRPQDQQAMRYRPGDYVLLEAPPGRIALDAVSVPPEYEPDWTALRPLAVSIGERTVRAYSLASYPGEGDSLKLVIRLALPPPSAPDDTPPGRVSSWAFTLQPGDRIALSGPFGTFHLRDTEREKIFVGGGAGIAPMRAMILGLLSERPQITSSFWYGARNLRELCYRDEFETLAQRHPGFSYCAALSQPESGLWDGPTGFIHRVLLERYLARHPAPEEAEYYLCGPPVMTGAVITMLDDLGVDRDSILLDDFGSGVSS